MHCHEFNLGYRPKLGIHTYKSKVVDAKIGPNTMSQNLDINNPQNPQPSLHSIFLAYVFFVDKEPLYVLLKGCAKLRRCCCYVVAESCNFGYIFVGGCCPFWPFSTAVIIIFRAIYLKIKGFTKNN